MSLLHSIIFKVLMKNRPFYKPGKKDYEAARCREIAAYDCMGFDTFGPFRLVGGIAKGHPTAEEIRGAVDFYRGL